MKLILATNHNTQMWSGAGHRLAQLMDLLERSGHTVFPVSPENCKAPRLSRVGKWAHRLEHFLSKGLHKKNYGAHLACLEKINLLLEENDDIKVILWENTNYLDVPALVLQRNVKVLAFPQNLEALVPASSAKQPETLIASLRNELELLKRADHVICISREEQLFLRAAGLKVDVLPYYPPPALKDRLLTLRARRVLSEKSHFLMLGSCTHAPTISGMQIQIQMLRKIQEYFPFRVDIAGNGTECLKDQETGPGVVIHGTVTDSQLEVFMLRAKAVLVHQDFGAGALTRIPECLVAGIPVIASRHASRSAWGYKGVYIYDNDEELAELLRLDLPESPGVDDSLVDEKWFSQRLNHWIL